MQEVINLINGHDPLLGFRWKILEFPVFTEVEFNSWYVEKIEIPFGRFESIPIYMNGSNSYYQSVFDVDPINITFYEDSQLTTTKMLSHWRSFLYRDGFYGLPSEYKKTITIGALATHSNTPIGFFRAHGAWPTSIDNISYASDSSERITISVSFTIDDMQFSTSFSKLT